MSKTVITAIAAFLMATAMVCWAQAPAQNSSSIRQIQSSNQHPTVTTAPVFADLSGSAPEVDNGAPSSSHDLPEAPSATRTYASASFPTQDQHHSEPAPPAASGALTYGEQRAMDWKFDFLTGALFASSISNAELTVRCLQDHTCAYVPIPLRSRAALYGIGLPTDVAVSYFSLRAKAKGRRYWWIGDAVLTTANVIIGAHALHRIRQQ